MPNTPPMSQPQMAARPAQLCRSVPTFEQRTGHLAPTAAAWCGATLPLDPRPSGTARALIPGPTATSAATLLAAIGPGWLVARSVEPCENSGQAGELGELRRRVQTKSIHSFSMEIVLGGRLGASAEHRLCDCVAFAHPHFHPHSAYPSVSGGLPRVPAVSPITHVKTFRTK